LTVKVLLAEVETETCGGRVVGISGASAAVTELALEFPSGRRETLCLSPGEGGAFFVAGRPTGRAGRRVGGECGELVGANLIAGRQWLDDRVVVFDFLTNAGRKQLGLELFGRAGGLFLTDGAAVVRLGGRKLDPGAEYTFPPDRRRRSPAPATAEEMEPYLAVGGERALVAAFAYMSPLAAAAILAGGDAGAAARRFAVFARAVAGDVLEPVAVRRPADKWRPFPCDIFDGLAIDEVRRFPRANDAVAFAYYENRRAAVFTAAQRRLRGRFRAAVRRLERQRLALAALREDYGRGEEYRRMGEALKYKLAAVKRGHTMVCLADPYGGEDVVVELEPALSPRENVARLFSLYRKAKRGRGAVAARLETVDEELAAATAKLAAVERARTLEDLGPWLDAGDEAGTSRRGRRPVAVPGRRYLSSDGLLIILGRNARENDELTFRYARPHDLWLHAQQAHGSHVVVRRADKKTPVPSRTVQEAAALAAARSGARHAAFVPVVVVERRHVRRVRGSAGRVTFRGEKVLFVEPSEKLKAAPAPEPAL